MINKISTIMNRGFRHLKNGDLAYYPFGFYHSGYIVDEHIATKIKYWQKNNSFIEIPIFVLIVLGLISITIFLSKISDGFVKGWMIILVFSHLPHFIIYLLKIRPLIRDCRNCDEQLSKSEIIYQGAIKIQPWVWFILILITILIAIAIIVIGLIQKPNIITYFVLGLLCYGLYSLFVRFRYSHIYYQRLIEEKIKAQSENSQ